MQPLDRPGGGVAAIHHDRTQRVSERGSDRRLGARLDLEQIDERADDAVDARELLDTRRSPCRTEAEVERVGAGAPTAPPRPRCCATPHRHRAAWLPHQRRHGGRRAERLRSPRRASASSLRSTPASATSVSSTPASAAAVSSRSTPRSFSATSAAEPACALARGLHAHQPVGERVVADDRQRALGVDHRHVELAKRPRNSVSRCVCSARASRSRSMRACSPAISWPARCSRIARSSSTSPP